MIVLLCPWIYRDEVPSWEGELIATPGRPCLLLDSVPKLISFAYAAEKTSVSHTHSHTHFPEMALTLCPPSFATIAWKETVTLRDSWSLM